MIDTLASSLPLADSGKATDMQPFLTTRHWMRCTRGSAVLALAALALGAVLGAYLGAAFQRRASHSSWPAASSAVLQGTVQSARGTGTVGALGRLMPQGDAITLTLPFGAGDARVARWLVSEGEHVSVGQVMAELDSLPQRLAFKAIAAADLLAKQAALAKARSEARLGWEEAQAASHRAQAARLLATQELARTAALVHSGVTTQAQLEQAQAVVTQVEADHMKAQAAMRHRAHHDGNAQPDVQWALANLHTAQAVLVQATQAVDSARVTASLSGTVLTVHARVGEKPGERGMATLGNVDRMAAELEVYQTDIRRVAAGQNVVLTSASLDAPLTGTVEQVGMAVQRQAVFSSDPVSHTDARVVRVKVALDPSSSVRARAFTGLQVAASIAVAAP